ncbi:MAG: carboxypeptidase regulatory-like domain-containing protein, partial [Chitinophagaceae bacterium]
MKYALLVFLVILTAFTKLKAQGTISGRLTDSVSKQNLSLATVTVFKAKDTVIITYRLTDATGNFKVPGLPLDLLSRVVISFSGYRSFRQEFVLTKEQNSLDLGVIKMVND